MENFFGPTQPFISIGRGFYFIGKIIINRFVMYQYFSYRAILVHRKITVTNFLDFWALAIFYFKEV